jgi:beta-lactamase superfamily II metal-dependent hydrolase
MERARNHLYKNLLTYFLLAIFSLGYTAWSSYQSEKVEKGSGFLKFVVLDIGQGDALYIESPTGKQVLVDGGPNNNLARALPRVVSQYDKHIDLLVVTNPDFDHYGGFIKLLDKYKVDAVLEPGTFNKYPAYTVLENKITEKQIPKMLARKGQVIDLGGGAHLDVIFPDRDVSEMSSNDGSIVMKLVYGDTSVLLQGDSTAKIEQYLRDSVSSTTLQATILKAGHHGSRTSSTLGYVKIVNPKWTVISSGKNNDYGHPHKETLETMKELGIPTYDTCNNGDLVFISDGKNFTFENKNPNEPGVGCKVGLK